MLKLERRGKVSLHRQIRVALEEMLSKREGDTSVALPPEERLAEEFSVSRGTVRQAISDLVRRGIVYRVQGKGTYLADGAFTCCGRIAVLERLKRLELFVLHVSRVTSDGSQGTVLGTGSIR